MDPHDRLSELFSKIIDLPHSERSSFLDRTCEGNSELRARLEDLLAHDGDAPLLSTRSPITGLTIGGYAILEKIGEGGMGAVYRAQQQSPRRNVALKILHPWTLDRASRKRFSHEIELLSRLKHPAIASIYEAGVTHTPFGDLPYFAMELVEGTTLLEYAASRDLSVETKLLLFSHICEGIEHAHLKRVIHRDIKPGNILVDESGHPKVIDFGIAKATNSDLNLTSRVTRTGEILGTLQYMSPEQLGGGSDEYEVDFRSDVYSLGLVLHELVLGAPPYDVTGLKIGEAVSAIQDRESTPRRFPRKLRDLERVVIKALSVDPARRYDSVAELRREINRYLAGEPVAAAPKPLLMTFLRWARKYPILATVVGCCLLAGMIFMSAFVALKYWGVAANHAEVGSTRRIAYAKSRAGMTLHFWDSGKDGGIVYAESALSDSRDRVFLIGYSLDSSPPPPAGDRMRGHVVAYDASDLSTILWSTLDHELIPPSTPEHEATELPAVLDTCPPRLSDIWDEVPGPELIVVQKDASVFANRNPGL